MNANIEVGTKVAYSKTASTRTGAVTVRREGVVEEFADAARFPGQPAAALVRIDTNRDDPRYIGAVEWMFTSTIEWVFVADLMEVK